MLKTAANFKFHKANIPANAVINSTGSSTRKKIVLFHVENKCRQYRPTLL
tara:strand:+ start:4947 stop:5096 length:150 start_codon:yes stop_codon:yes gene_type:complete